MCKLKNKGSLLRAGWTGLRFGGPLFCGQTPPRRLSPGGLHPALSRRHETLLPFTASVSVAVTHTITHTGLFEVHTLRSLPWGDHFSSLVAIGRAKPEEDENGAVIRGEIQPTQRGITIYSGVITLMSLWISAAAVSSVISPMTSLFPAVVATTATVVVTAIILALLTADVRHLSSVLEGIR